MFILRQLYIFTKFRNHMGTTSKQFLILEYVVKKQTFQVFAFRECCSMYLTVFDVYFCIILLLLQ